MSYQKTYYPKRPIKSFQDLEVYQKSLSSAVNIVKRVGTDLSAVRKENQDALIAEKIQSIASKLIDLSLSLPHLIAYAHSIRFTDSGKALDKLEEVMLASNLTVVSLEEYRDICNNGIEHEFFEEQIKNLLSTRHKVLYLQRSWKKFMKE